MLSKRMNSLMLIEMIAYSELMKRKSTVLMATTAVMVKMAMTVMMEEMEEMAVMVVTEVTVVMAVTETVKQLRN